MSLINAEIDMCTKQGDVVVFEYALVIVYINCPHG